VVLLRKSIPQKTNLQTAAELSVTKGKKFKATASEASQKQKRYFLKNECFGFSASARFVFLAS
jgi:hypothetical protein